MRCLGHLRPTLRSICSRTLQLRACAREGIGHRAPFCSALPQTPCRFDSRWSRWTPCCSIEVDDDAAQRLLSGSSRVFGGIACGVRDPRLDVPTNVTVVRVAASLIQQASVMTPTWRSGTDSEQRLIRECVLKLCECCTPEVCVLISGHAAKHRSTHAVASRFSPHTVWWPGRPRCRGAVWSDEVWSPVWAVDPDDATRCRLPE